MGENDAEEGRHEMGPPFRRLILASRSSTRLRVLRDAGIFPEVAPSGVSEEIHTSDTAAAVVALAERKASEVAAHTNGALVLGCDSLLDQAGSRYGKPTSLREAERILRSLSGREATLHTGQCMIDTRTNRRVSGVASTLVHIGAPSDEELTAYLASGEPMHMAGAISIDGLGAPFVRGVEGDPSTVLGLSLPLLRQMLADLGLSIHQLWRDACAPVIRDLAATDRPWLTDLVSGRWGIPVVTPSGPHDPAELPGLVAEGGGELLGALTFRTAADGMEVVTLDSLAPGSGVGTALLGAARRRASEQRTRLWLATTDDNLDAVAFYRHRGMDIVRLHRGFADRVRRLKPVGRGSGPPPPYRHALELEYPSPDA